MTKIFLDSASPLESVAANRILAKQGFVLDGQTTNPTNLKNYLLGSTSITAKALTHEDAQGYYRDTIVAISTHVNGPVSVQVIAQEDTTVDSILAQARDFRSWIPRAVVKIPCTKNGLAAAEIFCKEGAVNITQVFTQEQAAAAYAATINRGVDTSDRPYDTFVSVYVGKLDDSGVSGMDIVANTLAMYRQFGDGHMQVLAASIRNTKHILYAFKLDCDVLTAPLSVLDGWCEAGCPKPSDDFVYDPGLGEIPYREIPLDNSWEQYHITNELTQSGQQVFYSDWQDILAPHP